ncbi:hypothetical protein D3C75_765610 [compost metagenome]
MAKSREEMKRLLTPVRHYKRPVSTTCGCGRPAKYLVYEHQEPHCQTCFEEAISSKNGALVRSIEGGYDDAS